jgi:hypothetical protein
MSKNNKPTAAAALPRYIYLQACDNASILCTLDLLCLDGPRDGGERTWFHGTFVDTKAPVPLRVHDGIPVFAIPAPLAVVQAMVHMLTHPLLRDVLREDTPDDVPRPLWKASLEYFGFWPSSAQEEEQRGIKRKREEEERNTPKHAYFRRVVAALADAIVANHPKWSAFLAGQKEELHCYFINAYKGIQPGDSVTTYRLPIPGEPLVDDALIAWEFGFLPTFESQTRPETPVSQVWIGHRLAEALLPVVDVVCSVRLISKRRSKATRRLVINGWPAGRLSPLPSDYDICRIRITRNKASVILLISFVMEWPDLVRDAQRVILMQHLEHVDRECFALTSKENYALWHESLPAERAGAIAEWLSTGNVLQLRRYWALRSDEDPLFPVHYPMKQREENLALICYRTEKDHAQRWLLGYCLSQLHTPEQRRSAFDWIVGTVYSMSQLWPEAAANTRCCRVASEVLLRDEGSDNDRAALARKINPRTLAQKEDVLHYVTHGRPFLPMSTVPAPEPSWTLLEALASMRRQQRFVHWSLQAWVQTHGSGWKVMVVGFLLDSTQMYAVQFRVQDMPRARAFILPALGALAAEEAQRARALVTLFDLCVPR